MSPGADHIGVGKVIVSRSAYKGWDAVKIRSGPLELVLVPQVGGRVMSTQWRGVDLSFTQPEREGLVEELSSVRDVRAKKRAMGFPLWGGEKTWLAPQSRWPDGLPFLDLDSGCYGVDIEEAGPEAAVVRMTSPLCRESGVQLTRTVRLLAGDSAWSVRHQLRNGSPREVEWAIWDVAMVRRPGRVYLPRNPSSPYPEGVKTFCEEGESSRLRRTVVGALGELAMIACEHPAKFKFGVDAPGDGNGTGDRGWILGLLEASGSGLIGYRKRVPLYRGESYGHGCVAEVYNSDVYGYCELETHGPLVRLSPGGSFELEEQHGLCEVASWPRTAEEVIALASSGGMSR